MHLLIVSRLAGDLILIVRAILARDFCDMSVDACAFCICGLFGLCVIDACFDIEVCVAGIAGIAEFLEACAIFASVLAVFVGFCTIDALNQHSFGSGIEFGLRRCRRRSVACCDSRAEAGDTNEHGWFLESGDDLQEVFYHDYDPFVIMRKMHSVILQNMRCIW